jgi:hypothetical protein
MTLSTPNFSAGLLKDRPTTAPENAVYYATDEGERFRFDGKTWSSIGKVEDVKPEVMEKPADEVVAQIQTPGSSTPTSKPTVDPAAAQLATKTVEINQVTKEAAQAAAAPQAAAAVKPALTIPTASKKS